MSENSFSLLNMVKSLPPLSRRERRVAARKAQIIEAAAEVFSRQGYEHTTTKQIAETADLAEGTLYNYFANKRDLLIAVAQDFAQDVTNALAQTKATSMEAVMAELLTARFRSGRERRLFMLFLHESRFNPDVRQYYVEEAIYTIITETEKIFRQLIADGVMRPVNPAVAARTISATIMGYAALYEFLQEIQPDGDGRFTPNQLGQEVTDNFIKGLQK